MQEHGKVNIYEPAQRPHSLRREIALPQGLCMAPQESVPNTLATLGAGIKSVLCQGGLHGLPKDTDPEPFAVPENAGVSLGILVSEFWQSIADFARRSWAGFRCALDGALRAMYICGFLGERRAV